MEKILVELTPLMANVLQRMLVEEIDNQKNWAAEEKRKGYGHEDIREKIVGECEYLIGRLEEYGFPRYVKYY